MPVDLIATLDTKGVELGFVRSELAVRGIATRVLDAGSGGPPLLAADVPRERVFEAAGTSWDSIRSQQDRGTAVAAAARGITALVTAAESAGELEGVLALGGSAGTTIGTAAMRALPLGIPKVMVSTLASGQTRPFVGGKDLLLFNSVVDLAGLNRISRAVLANAAAAMAGMVQARASAKARCTPQPSDRPVIAATMFGVTTPCVEAARQTLTAAGYEVLVFHATGTGGEAMEGLIADGLIAGVLDITTTELADELVGGVMSAGPSRLTAAALRGIPQVVSVGATDMVNFGPRATVPDQFRDRHFHIHNAAVTLMRTTPDENRQIGFEIGQKVGHTCGPATILFPTQGVSALDRSGGSFDDPLARQELLAGIRAGLAAVAARGDSVTATAARSVECVCVEAHINDPEFAQRSAEMLLDLLARHRIG